jgi:hypothetical protein
MEESMSEQGRSYKETGFYSADDGVTPGVKPDLSNRVKTDGVPSRKIPESQPMDRSLMFDKDQGPKAVKGAERRDPETVGTLPLSSGRAVSDASGWSYFRQKE